MVIMLINFADKANMLNLVTKNLNVIFICLFVLHVIPSQAIAQASFSLDGKAIDLLVGSPAGQFEPLDSRRTQIEVDKEEIVKLLVDDPIDFSDQEFSWHDAQSKHHDKDRAEYVLYDLLADIGELDFEEFAESFDENQQNSLNQNQSYDNLE